ncbi:MAG: hypothetical protein ACKVXR_19010, partial [Planctomycetota bacterium]
MLALLLVALAQAHPGVVVLAGAGAAIDEKSCAELGGRDRLLLAVGDPSGVVDPLAAAGAPKARVDLDARRPFAGDDRETAERIRSAPCIVLAGGGALDWFELVTPGGGTSRLSDSIRAAHRDGATIVGCGAAAPYLAKWFMVERSALPDPERNPRRHREDAAVEGLGLVRGLLVDTSAREQGDPGGMLRIAFDGHLERALYLEGPTIWIDDPDDRSARVAGSGRSILFDLGAARRQRGTWRGARLSLLRDGDRWSERGNVECGEGGAA